MSVRCRSKRRLDLEADTMEALWIELRLDLEGHPVGICVQATKC